MHYHGTPGGNVSSFLAVKLIIGRTLEQVIHLQTLTLSDKFKISKGIAVGKLCKLLFSVDLF